MMLGLGILVFNSNDFIVNVHNRGVAGVVQEFQESICPVTTPCIFVAFVGRDGVAAIGSLLGA